MAEQFLEEIYLNSKLVTDLRYMVEQFERNTNAKGWLLLQDILPRLEQMCQEAEASGYSKLQLLFDTVNRMTDSVDVFALSAICERELAPIMEDYISTFGRISLDVDEKYSFESSKNGFLTIKNREINAYLHSTMDPYLEAIRTMGTYYDPIKSTMRIFGCGLGYHLYALHELSGGSVDIILYEEDPRIIEYARAYGVLDWIPESELTIVTEDATQRFLSEVSDQGNEGYWLQTSAVISIEDHNNRDLLLNLVMNRMMVACYSVEETVNFSRILLMDLPDCSEACSDFVGDEIIIAAAGPSLGNCYDFLRESMGTRRIISVGTSLRKLLAEGIRPDCVCMQDPTNDIHPQIEGIEDCGIPMICSSTTDWRTVRDYKGPKCMMHTSHIDPVERYAKDNGQYIWPTGGSVATMALSLAVGLRVGKIYMVGMDMAYTDDQAHADGTATSTSKETVDGDIYVDGIEGNKLRTEQALFQYRLWIEDFIKNNPGPLFYNVSSRGARINGTIEVTHKGSRIVE